jgi:hypothetical protein
MKRISTLLSLLAISAISNAQNISESFENYSTLAPLTNNCWSFTDVNLTTTSGITGTHSLTVLPATSNGGSSATPRIGQIMTPYINLIAGTSITLNAKISNRLSTTGTRTVSARFLDLAGNYTPVVATVTFDRSTNAAGTYSLTIPVAASEVKKLVIDVNGAGDGNTYLLMDDFTYASTFNTSAPYACGSSTIALPIKLLGFSGHLDNHTVKLQWSVADNHTGDRFEIQKSTNGSTFNATSILFTTAAVGNESYTYNDPAAFTTTVYYRIKIVNKNNTTSFSPVVTVKGAAVENKNIRLMQNPVQETMNLQYTSAVKATMSLNIYTMTGVKVQATTLTVNEGMNSLTLPLVSSVSKGMYVATLSSGNEHTTIKFSKK